MNLDNNLILKELDGLAPKKAKHFRIRINTDDYKSILKKSTKDISSTGYRLFGDKLSAFPASKFKREWLQTPRDIFKEPDITKVSASDSIGINMDGIILPNNNITTNILNDLKDDIVKLKDDIVKLKDDIEFYKDELNFFHTGDRYNTQAKCLSTNANDDCNRLVELTKLKAMQMAQLSITPPPILIPKSQLEDLEYFKGKIAAATSVPQELLMGGTILTKNQNDTCSIDGAELGMDGISDNREIANNILIAKASEQISEYCSYYSTDRNVPSVRNELKLSIEIYLKSLYDKREIVDYIVTCDQTNNTPTIIDNNILLVDVAIKPTPATGFIYIPTSIGLINGTVNNFEYAMELVE